MEEIKVQPTEQQEDPKHAEAMIKKAEGSEGAPDGSGEDLAPQLLAGKYKTEEELQKGVLELLKHQNKDMSFEDIYKNLSKPPVTKKEEEEEEEATEGESKDLDFTPYFEELSTTGVLSEDSYKTLEAKGFPKDFVDTFIEGQKALAERENQAFYNIVDGKENYDAMIKWASLNLPENEIQAFNDAITTNIDVAKFATEALYSRYKASEGEPPKGFIKGSVASTGASGGVYESIAQLTADMSKPEYEKDPAFRRMVQEKLGRSKIL